MAHHLRGQHSEILAWYQSNDSLIDIAPTDVLDEQRELVAQEAETLGNASRNSSGIDYKVIYNKPSKNFVDAMSSKDSVKWMEAYRKEYQGFKDRRAVGIVIPPRCSKVLGSMTHTDYKVVQGVLQKRKVRLCTRGDQQVYSLC